VTKLGNMGRVIRAASVLAAVALLAALAPVAGGAASAGRPVHVWFVGADGLVAVERPSSTLALTVRKLLTGPSAAERERGLRSAIPSGTPLLGVASKRRIVTVDLGPRFAVGKDVPSLQARVGQVVRTLRGVPGVKAVRITIAGGTPVGLFPGYDLTRPVTSALEHEAPHEPTTRDLQQLLADLGYLARGAVSGRIDDATATAVLAFQKWTGLPRDGQLGDLTVSALLRAVRPEPQLREPGRRIEVHLRRQVALLIQDNRVVRTIHVSTGAGGATPIGSFRVYRKEQYSWSVPFKVWLPWASYFTGGIAFHEYGSVPTYAASHGCIRVTRNDAQMLYGFAEYGTPVHVLWETS
jgi:L,D-transpeptidase catalytic domain/Sporulation and spore germination/Putative peptidoglycan binding domain